MQVLEDTAQRLVLQDRSVINAALLALASALVVPTLLLTPIAGLIGLLRQPDAVALVGLPLRLFGLAALPPIGVVLLGAGALTSLHQWRGVTATFDSTAKTLTLVRPRGLRHHTSTRSLYGVARPHVESNAELRACALLLVLRSGERLHLCARALDDCAQADQLAARITARLHALSER